MSDNNTLNLDSSLSPEPAYRGAFLPAPHIVYLDAFVSAPNPLHRRPSVWTTSLNIDVSLSPNSVYIDASLSS
jgi:hypothetical protein